MYAATWRGIEPEPQSIVGVLSSWGWTVSQTGNRISAKRGNRFFPPVVHHRKWTRVHLLMELAEGGLQVVVESSALLGGERAERGIAQEILVLLGYDVHDVENDPAVSGSSMWRVAARVLISRLWFVVLLAWLCAMLATRFVNVAFTTDADMGPAVASGSRILCYVGPGKESLASTGRVVLVPAGTGFSLARIVADEPGMVRLENGRIVTTSGLIAEPYASGTDATSESYELADGDVFTIEDVRDDPHPQVLSRSQVIGVVVAVLVGPGGPRIVQ